jgi:hypothetical protein
VKTCAFRNTNKPKFYLFQKQPDTMMKSTPGSDEPAKSVEETVARSHEPEKSVDKSTAGFDEPKKSVDSAARFDTPVKVVDRSNQPPQMVPPPRSDLPVKSVEERYDQPPKSVAVARSDQPEEVVSQIIQTPEAVIVSIKT